MLVASCFYLHFRRNQIIAVVNFLYFSFLLNLIINIHLHTTSDSKDLGRIYVNMSWEIRDLDKEPLVLRACRQNPISRKKVLALLEEGCDVNACSSTGITALHLACFKNNYSISRLLINYKADVNIQELRYGYTPLHVVIKYTNDIRLVQLLVKHHADLTIQDKSSSTCLNLACNKQLTEAVRIILEANSSNINIGNFFTPLATACDHGNIEICKLLLSHNADPNKTSGYLPVHYAVKNPETFQLLLEVTNIQKIEKFYKNHQVFSSFLIYLLFFVDNAKCFDVFMSCATNFKSSQLKSLEIMHFFQCQFVLEMFEYSNILEKFLYCFRYYTHLEPIDFLPYLSDEIDNKEENFLKFVRFVHLLLQMGIPNYDSGVLDFKTKMLKFSENLSQKLANHDPRKALLENIQTIVKESVLTLKQLSRKAFRNFVSKKDSDPWLCYSYVKCLHDIPPSIKNYTWYC